MVRQPNGKFARFSDVVDNFTHINLTREEAVLLCQDCGLSEDWSEVKVMSAESESVLGKNGLENGPPDGLRRWRESIETIDAIHGIELC